MENNKKAVIYCRVSTKEQVEEGNSLVTQEKICRDYAIKNGYEIIEVFIEQGESAKTQDRTELKRLLAYCAERKNKVDAVIAYKIDRISRNTDDYSQIRILLKRYNVEIKSTSEYFENTPAGRFMENIIANVAQFDNDVRTERSVNGSRDAMREGRYVWVAPYGYINRRIGGKSTIIPDDKAELVKKAFEEVAKNLRPTEEVRMRTTKEGLVSPNGKPLSKSQFYRLLKNETYAGWIIKFGERHRGIFEPLVTEAVFGEVQRVLKRRAHKCAPYQKENADFPLRRFVRNPDGIKLTGSWSQGRSKKYAYYRFMKAKGFERGKDSIEISFQAFLNDFQLSEHLIGKLGKYLNDNLNKTTAQDSKKVAQLRLYLSGLKEKQGALVQKNLDGVISNTVLREELDRIGHEVYKINEMLSTVPDEKENIGDLFNFAKDYLEKPGYIWNIASFQQKLKLQWFEFPKGITFDGRKFRTTEIANIFKPKQIIQPLLSHSVPAMHVSSNNPEIKNTSDSILLSTLKEEIKTLAGIIKEIKGEENNST